MQKNNFPFIQGRAKKFLSVNNLEGVFCRLFLYISSTNRFFAYFTANMYVKCSGRLNLLTWPSQKCHSSTHSLCIRSQAGLFLNKYMFTKMLLFNNLYFLTKFHDCMFDKFRGQKFNFKNSKLNMCKVC